MTGIGRHIVFGLRTCLRSKFLLKKFGQGQFSTSSAVHRKWGKPDTRPVPPFKYGLKPGEKVDEFEKAVYEMHYVTVDQMGYKLHMAGLYMQATEGPNKTPEPPKDDHKEHSYWTAWKQLGDMSKEEAKKQYVQEANKYIQKKKSPRDDIDFNL